VSGKTSWIREPLVLFLALGALMFLLFGLFGTPDTGATDRIVVTEPQIEFLVQAFGKTWQRPPTEQELSALVDDYVREEIYYREALAMGLDREDTIIRRRLRQKLEFLTDDISAMREPTEEELQAYLEANPEAFRVPARLSFEQIYLNPDTRGESIEANAKELLESLRRPDSDLEAAELERLGDPIMLPTFVGMATEPAIDRRFGAGFASLLVDFKVGEWDGPVESGFGAHLVRVRERHEGESPPLAEVRDAVEREWRNIQRTAASDTFYAGLRERYTIEVEWPEPASGAESTEAPG